MVFAALCWALWKVWGRSSLLLHRVQANAAAQYPLRHFAVVGCNIKRKHYKQQYTVVDSKKIAWTDLLYTVQVYSIQWDNSSISSSSPSPSSRGRSREMKRAKSEFVKNQKKLLCKDVIAAKRKNYCIALRRTKYQPRVRTISDFRSRPSPAKYWAIKCDQREGRQTGKQPPFHNWCPPLLPAADQWGAFHIWPRYESRGVWNMPA